MPIAPVQFGRDMEEAYGAGAQVLRPLERIHETGAVWRRVPFNHNQFRRNGEAAAMAKPAIDKRLHSAQQIASMVVIAGCHHEGEIRDRKSTRLNSSHLGI